jgi:superfamily II DNA helicase RecQ
MHSYADRYTHDFFFERDYPDVTILASIYALLEVQPQEKREIQKLALMDPEVFDRALEKLWTHGGAVVDYAENVTRGHDDWRQPYLAQAEHKRQQVERMIRYAESSQCRMANVVRHFGDVADGEKPCGICDYCAPQTCTAQRFRTATEAEHAALLRTVAELRAGGAKSTGRLYGELFPRKEMSRDDFENLLGGMARAGIVSLADATFEKDGRQIPYRTARLTPAGSKLDARTPVNLVMKDQEPAATPHRRSKVDKQRILATKRGSPDKSSSGRPEKRTNRPSDSRPDSVVEEALREWRRGEARRLGVPAFRIFTDRALTGLVEQRPRTSSEMLAVPGIGLRIAEKYGPEICRILLKKQ